MSSLCGQSLVGRSHEVAPGVVGERGTGCGGVLVQAVGGVALGAVGVARPLVQVVGPALAHDFLHGVAGVGRGLVLRGARRGCG